MYTLCRFKYMLLFTRMRKATNFCCIITGRNVIVCYYLIYTSKSDSLYIYIYVYVHTYTYVHIYIYIYMYKYYIWNMSFCQNVSWITTYVLYIYICLYRERYKEMIFIFFPHFFFIYFFIYFLHHSSILNSSI